MTSFVSIQNALNSGELSPSLFGRVDAEKWHNGLSTCRNFFVNYRGGIMSRPGFAYVGMCKQQFPAAPPRDISFQFSLGQGFVLEFGDQYMRIKQNGAYVTETSQNISGISQANPGSITVAGHGYSPGDWVFISRVQGMTNFNGLTWIVNTVPDANHFTVTDLFGVAVDTTLFPAWTSGGTAARIYTVAAPYAAVDLPYLKYTQSADTMTLCLVNQETNFEYPPYDLVRHGNTNWVFTVQDFATKIAAPTGLTTQISSSNTTDTWYSYVVTAVDSTTGEESNASLAANVQNNDIAIFEGSNTLTWNKVAGAGSYNIYAATPSFQYQVPASALYGFIGTSLGNSFVDTNIQPDFSVVPPVHKNPFARGQIIDIVPTNGGTQNYSQQTIGYSITTSTGSGFVGVPIVNNGFFAGFVIQNPGKNYKPSDTVTITDSGGGLARGTYTFSGSPNPAPWGATFGFRINGVTFQITGPEDDTNTGADNIRSGTTLATTLASLAQGLNASDFPSINIASYSSDATHLYITYRTPGAAGNAFTLTAGSGEGMSWTVSGATLTGGGTAGTGATGTLTVGPQSGTYPAVPAYFQQRRVYGNTLNNPDTYYMSQSGLYLNMDSSIPVTASDAIVGTPWAQQVNGIQFLVPVPNGLITLTGKSAWLIDGGNSIAVTPSDQNARAQAYTGCNNHVPPIVVNYDILYVQSKGAIVRDLSYNFFVNIYTGTDISILSNHLFLDKQINQWAYAEEPYKLIWAVRDDGVMLCLTYLKEQEVMAWSRHDTDGLFLGVCTITEPPVDAIYVITQRFVKGAWRYYSERMNDRLWSTLEQSFCVDAGLAYPQTFPSATLTPSAASGTGVTFSTDLPVFNSGMVGNVIRVGGGNATITSYVNSTEVVCDINVPITSTLPNDPNNRPLPASNDMTDNSNLTSPAITGSWSISVPTTVVTALNHLEGMTVAILADGSVVENQVVTNGQITLPQAASNIVVGLPYTCQAQSLYLDHPLANGSTSQNRRRDISAVGLRVEQSRGLKIGADQPDASVLQTFTTPDWQNLVEIKDRTNQVLAGNGTPLFTGDFYQSVTASWTAKGQVAIQQDYPLPASVLSIIPYWTVGDEK